MTYVIYADTKMQTEISNPELKKLDERVAEFYKLSDRYMSAIANLYGREVYKKELSEILKTADKITPESEFDKLILRNIQSNLNLNDLVIDFFSNPNFSLSVEDFIDKIAGKGAWKYLEERVREPLWKERWGYSGMIQERNSARVSPFVEEAQEAAKAQLPRLKEDVLKYGKSRGYLPKNFDTTILLLPPKEVGEEESYWNPVTKVLSLGSYNFDFFHKKGKVIAIPTRAYKTAFHEVLGHAAHQINSDDFPFSLKIREEIGAITPTKSVIEGFATDTQKQSYKFLRENSERLRITETDIQILEIEDELAIRRRYESMYGALLKEKELREKEFDGYEHLLNLTNNFVIAKGFKEDFKLKFSDIWQYFGHVFGRLHWSKMEGKVKKEFGANYLEKNKKKFHKATASGVWSWAIYPEAVCYFLREK